MYCASLGLQRFFPTPFDRISAALKRKRTVNNEWLRSIGAYISILFYGLGEASVFGRLIFAQNQGERATLIKASINNDCEEVSSIYVSQIYRFVKMCIMRTKLLTGPFLGSLVCSTTNEISLSSRIQGSLLGFRESVFLDEG